MFRRHEMSKRRKYDQRVRDVEMSTFTPLVFSASGGFGPPALVNYKRIASRLSNKWSLPYSAIMGWLRCRVSFALLRLAVMCLRGSRQHVRGSLGSPVLAIAEGQFRIRTFLNLNLHCMSFRSRLPLSFYECSFV